MSPVRSVAKHSYIKGAKGKARAKAHVNYIQNRSGQDREDGKPRPFFSADRDNIQGKEVVHDINVQERSKVVIHKLILSPGIDGVDMRAYTRDVLQHVGRLKGLDLDWRAVQHGNTDHGHSHVIVLGKDKNGREVLFDRRDYAKFREAGDRYLDRNHFLERHIQRDDRNLDKMMERDADQVLDKYNRARGDNIFEQLVKDLNSTPNREPPVKLREWDKDKAIEHLPASEKIERAGETYTKYSNLDQLKDLGEKLRAGEGERLPMHEYKKLWEWIGAKERNGDDFYDRKARDKWDKKERKKNRDPGEEDREWKKLDKDARNALRNLESTADGFGKGHKQRLREQQGRMAGEHGDYSTAMELKRLQDLMDMFPERREEFEKQLEEFKRFDQELQGPETKDKWDDFNTLLGANWKTPEKTKEHELAQTKSSERQMENEQMQRSEQEQHTDRDDKDRDEDAFARGEL